LLNTPTGFDKDCPGSEDVRAKSLLLRNKTQAQVAAMWRQNRREKVADLQRKAKSGALGAYPDVYTTMRNKTYLEIMHEGLGAWGSVSWLFAIGYRHISLYDYYYYYYDYYDY
jgi:hypothetical protein